MPAAGFVDTNILLYAISNRPKERKKITIAREILRTERWNWSTQVAENLQRAPRDQSFHYPSRER